MPKLSKKWAVRNIGWILFLLYGLLEGMSTGKWYTAGVVAFFWIGHRFFGPFVPHDQRYDNSPPDNGYNNPGSYMWRVRH